MNFYEAIALAATVPPAVIAATAYIVRLLLNQVAARDLEKYKHQLQNEVTAFKVDLEKLAFEHQTKFSAMHARRAEVIALLYGLIQECRRRVEEMGSPMQTGGKDQEKERRELAIDSYNQMAECFTKNRIYLASASTKRTEHLLKVIQRAFFDLDVAKGNYGTPVDTAGWLKAWKSIKDEVPPVLEALEVDFRDTLGVEPAAKI